MQANDNEDGERRDYRYTGNETSNIKQSSEGSGFRDDEDSEDESLPPLRDPNGGGNVQQQPSLISRIEPSQLQAQTHYVNPWQNNHLNHNTIDGEISEFSVTLCRARSMPSSHINAAARFKIFKNTPHGFNLLCSHAGCASEGIKFAWCKVCARPVAKRNFRKRHSHSEVLPTTQMMRASQQPVYGNSGRQAYGGEAYNVGYHGTRQREENGDGNTRGGKIAHVEERLHNYDESQNNVAIPSQQPSPPSNGGNFFHQNNSNSSESSLVNMPVNITAENRAQFNNFLQDQHQQQQQQHINQQVQNASTFNPNPMYIPDARSLPSSTTDLARNLWSALYFERPPNSDVPAVNKWLDAVLYASGLNLQNRGMLRQQEPLFFHPPPPPLMGDNNNSGFNNYANGYVYDNDVDSSNAVSSSAGGQQFGADGGSSKMNCTDGNNNNSNTQVLNNVGMNGGVNGVASNNNNMGNAGEIVNNFTNDISDHSDI